MIGDRSGRLAALAWASLCLFLFVCTVAAVVSGAAAPFDELLRDGIHHRASGELTALAGAVTHLGSLAVLAVFAGVTVAWLCAVGRRRDAFTLTLVMISAVVLENGLKYAIQRARPGAFFGTAPETYSFPSGHALFSLCFYGALAALPATRLRGAPRVASWAAAAMLILAVGLSRIYLGVHYPSDVIGGYLAAGFVIGVFRVFGRFEARHPRPPDPTRLLDPG